jgi:hypothetical protein
MTQDLQITTMWRTAFETCELVWSRFNGGHLKLWVKGRLILDEMVFDVETAMRRAAELRVEWPRLAE